MPCNRRSGTPLPCQQLAAARAQMLALSSGQAVAEVETPQLGRVSYTKADIPQLQRIIDGLAAQCAAAGGDPNNPATAMSMRRRPISIEAWP
jgi:hypothetical protein